MLSATKGQPELDLVRILFFLVQLLARRKYSTVVGALEGEGCSVTIIEEEEEEQKSWTKKKRGGVLAGRKEYLRKEVRTVLYT